MESSFKIILVAILIITAGNLTKNLFTDNSLKAVIENLELTKRSLDSAMVSNISAKTQIEEMQNSLDFVKIKKGIISLKFDSIVKEYAKAKDWDQKIEIIKRRKEINDSILILKDIAKHYK